MFKSLLLSSTILLSQLSTADSNFAELKSQLESYGFTVNIAIPPDFDLPNQQVGLRRKIRRPYGVLSAAQKSIWINPVVFDLGNSNAVLIHEAVHAAQYCAGNGKVSTLELDLEPISQAQPFFKRYSNIHNQEVEKEAYTVQTQPNSYQLVRSLLDEHCQS